MDVLIILGCICIVIGLIGCVVPGIAGPPFSFLALILLSFAKGWEPFSPEFLIGMAALTLVVTVLDYIVPAVGAKKLGASRYGFWGAIIGMIIGLIYAPPLGMIIGAFLGAIIGELLKGKSGFEALKAGWGVFIGIMVGMILKLIASGIMTFYFIKVLI
ncbi:MAG: DUF456 domain-containing protein [Candidatus Aminicenantaceae bacterium]